MHTIAAALHEHMMQIPVGTEKQQQHFIFA
jgi:hypothetical protein